MPLHSNQPVTLSSDIMGFLGVGKPIGFAAAKAKGINAEVKRRGITQFISHFRRCLPMTRRPLLFGDEIEYSPLKIASRLLVSRANRRACCRYLIVRFDEVTGDAR